jgi:V-type H+-transporting ATPase subunit G
MCVNLSTHSFLVSMSHPPDRVKRLKDARTEADEEIEAYRKAKDQEFSAFQSSVSPVPSALTQLLTTPFQHAGSTQDAQSIIDKETGEKLGQITHAYSTHKDDVLRKLLDRVVLVQPELHRNLRKQ